jgi:putative SOS response-associated peptidase YedK
MCGRYAVTTVPEAMRALFRYLNQPDFPPRYNIAPTQPVPIVRISEGRREFALMRWGLIPSWVKDPRGFSLLFNARGESAAEKPAFRNAMKRRRCLFPADGFYEWKQDGKAKRPYFVRLKAGGPMAFAGLWESWMGPNGEELETAAIVTTTASREIAHIHERMPVIVAPEAFDLWLDPNADPEMAAILIQPAPEALLESYPVSSAVNRVANDTPDLLDPLREDEMGEAAMPAPKLKRAKKEKEAAKRDDGQASLF